MYYWGFGIVYLVLTIAFVADVLRNPALSSGGKALWVVALLVAPVLSWLVYGIYRMRQSRGLGGL